MTLPNAYGIEVAHALATLVVFWLWVRSWRYAWRGRKWASEEPIDAAAKESASWKVRIYGWLVVVSGIMALGALGAVYVAPPEEIGRFWDSDQFSPARVTLVAVTMALGMACVSEHAQRRRLTMMT